MNNKQFNIFSYDMAAYIDESELPLPLDYSPTKKVEKIDIVPILNKPLDLEYNTPPILSRSVATQLNIYNQFNDNLFEFRLLKTDIEPLSQEYFEQNNDYLEEEINFSNLHIYRSVDTDGFKKPILLRSFNSA